MHGHHHDPHEGTAAEVIDRVREARATEHHAAVEQVRLAAQWALLHPCPKNEWPAHWGETHLFDETVTPLAGEGAPLVAEFAPASLGAALDLSADAARQLVADALELTDRFPRLWDLVQEGRVPVWRARAISRHTHDLPRARRSRSPTGSSPQSRTRSASSTPNDSSRKPGSTSTPTAPSPTKTMQLTRRGVWVKHRGNPATTDVYMTLETPDAMAFHGAVTILAAELAAFGDTGPLDVRRARAVGILADPQYAIDLLHGLDGTPSPPGRGARPLPAPTRRPHRRPGW